MAWYGLLVLKVPLNTNQLSSQITKNEFISIIKVPVKLWFRKPLFAITASPLPWTVPTGAKNAFIWLSAGPSDFLF